MALTLFTFVGRSVYLPWWLSGFSFLTPPPVPVSLAAFVWNLIN